MGEILTPNITPDILTLVAREKFRRKMIWVSKLVAVGLVLSIFWFGWVNYIHAKNINSILTQYGSLGYCYMCGKEAFKRCECQYNEAVYSKVNLTQVSSDLAIYNSQVCGMKDLASHTNPLSNFSLK